MARKRGRGRAACWYGIARTAVIDRAAAWAEIDDGGSAKIVTGVSEIGEGILTVLARSVGLPYFLLSSTGPLVQAWFARPSTGGAVTASFHSSPFWRNRSISAA